jgi:integrase
VKPPKQSEELLEPVKLEDITAMVSACESDFLGTRDKAVILCLLDNGCRASEFLSLEFGDIDIDTGTLIIRKGKGRKYRTVYLGQKSRRALRSYLRFHPNGMGHIWLTRSKERLNYEGLRDIVRRTKTIARGLVARQCHIKHTFSFAVFMDAIRSDF